MAKLEMNIDLDKYFTTFGDLCSSDIEADVSKALSTTLYMSSNVKRITISVMHDSEEVGTMTLDKD
jgi:hypothetical protein